MSVGRLVPVHDLDLAAQYVGVAPAKVRHVGPAQLECSRGMGDIGQILRPGTHFRPPDRSIGQTVSPVHPRLQQAAGQHAPPRLARQKVQVELEPLRVGIALEVEALPERWLVEAYQRDDIVRTGQRWVGFGLAALPPALARRATHDCDQQEAHGPTG